MNTVYLTRTANETLQVLDLSDDQLHTLETAMENLGQEVPPEAPIVYADGSPAGGLRELSSDGLRIWFRYDAANHAVMVADVRVKPSPNGTIALEKELAAAS